MARIPRTPEQRAAAARRYYDLLAAQGIARLEAEAAALGLSLGDYLALKKATPPATEVGADA